MASVASHQNRSVKTGDNIMVAGLSFQVFTLLIFMILCTDFALRTHKRYKSMGEDAFDQNPLYRQLRSGWRFKGFLTGLTLATICIFWRSVYRVAELSEGWQGALIKRQWLFVGFEGVMVIVACFALNLFNPAFTFKEAMEGLGGIGSGKKMRKQQKEKPALSSSNSDVEASRQV
jgi:hypothetical protein